MSFYSALVIGANGYIGLAVSQYLRARGYRVYGLIRKSENAKKLSQHEIHPVIGDSRKPETFEHLLNQIQIVIDASTDSEGSKAGFAVVKKHSSPQAKKIYIYTSGVLVHGDSLNLVTEDQVHPLKGFLADREAFEQHVIHSPEVYGFVIRPGFVYGYAGGNTGTHVDAFFNAGKNGGKSIIFGNKHRRHPWVHIYDLAHAYFLAIEKYTTATGQIFDIAYSTPTDEEISRKGAAIAGFPNAEVLEKEFPPEISYGALLNFNVLPSWKKANNLLGWTPNHPEILNDLEPLYEAWKNSQ